MSEEKNYPSLAKQGENLGKFVWELFQHTAKNPDSLLVSDEIYEERLNICKSCEWYDPEPIRCKKCGCWLQNKARMGLDSCPIGKWSANSDTFINEKFEELMKDLDNKEETN
jgi:hypothetical protein|tara:strand:+ start:143 stop:478 length:336 start_codon:yes stop_codon:yes gene_type:complete